MNKSESKYFNTALRMDEALIALLEEKDLEYITVKEICRRAGVNRSTFYLHYETIADLVNEKKIEGISYVNDESDRNGIRVVIILKQDAVASVVLNTLYKNTQLQSSFAVNNIALVDGRPMLLNLKDLIAQFVEHRHNVVVRRTRFDLKKAEERLHIVLGLLIAQDNIDEVIHIIRSSKDPEVARRQLTERFGLSDLQTAAIIEMRLRALTGLEHGKLTAERDDLEARIKYYNDVLSDVNLQMQIIKDEILGVRRLSSRPRSSIPRISMPTTTW